MTGTINYSIRKAYTSTYADSATTLQHRQFNGNALDSYIFNVSGGEYKQGSLTIPQYTKGIFCCMGGDAVFIGVTSSLKIIYSYRGNGVWNAARTLG